MTDKLRLSRYLWILLIPLFLQACGGGNVEILAPQHLQEFYDYPADYRFTYTGNSAGPVFLNSVDVTRYFSFDDGVAVGDAGLLRQYLKQGDNVFAVGLIQPRVGFWLDNKGPEVWIDRAEPDLNITRNVREGWGYDLLEILGGEPLPSNTGYDANDRNEPGGMFGGTYHIYGFLDDPSGARELKINGTPVLLSADAKFESVQPTVPEYVFEMWDMNDSYSRVVYKRRDQIVQRAAGAKITQNAVEQLTPIIKELLKDLKIPTDDDPDSAILKEPIRLVQILTQAALDGIDGTGMLWYIFDAINPLTMEILITNFEIDGIDIREMRIAGGFSLTTFQNWNGLEIDLLLKNLWIGVGIDFDLFGVIDFAIASFNFLLGLIGIDLDVPDYASVDIWLGDFGGHLDLGMEAKPKNPDAIPIFGDPGGLKLSVQNIHDFTAYGIPSDLVVRGADAASKLGIFTDAIFSAIRDILQVAHEIVFWLPNAILQAVINIILPLALPEINVGMKFPVSDYSEIRGVIGLIDLKAHSEGKGSDYIGLTFSSLIGAAPLTGDEFEFAPMTPIDSENIRDAEPFTTSMLEMVDFIPPDSDAGQQPPTLGFRHAGEVVPQHVYDAGGDISILTTGTVINQAINAVYESGILTIPVGIWADGEVEITTPENPAPYRILIRPEAPPEVAFSGNDVVITHLKIHNLVVYIQELFNGEYNTLYTIGASAVMPVIVGIQGDAIKLGIITPDYKLFTAKDDHTITEVIKNYRLNEWVTTFLFEKLNYALGFVEIPATFKFGDPAIAEIRLDELEVLDDTELKISASVNLNPEP